MKRWLCSRCIEELNADPAPGSPFSTEAIREGTERSDVACDHCNERGTAFLSFGGNEG